MSYRISAQAGLSDLAALFALPSTLALDLMTFDDQTITVHVVATATTAACPRCGTPGARIHSRYSRTLQDGVCTRRALIMQLRVRKWTCAVSTCPQRIFAERFPDLVQPYGRMTERTTQLLQTIGVTTSGTDAARVLAAIGVSTSAKTIIRRVLRLPLPPEGPVSAVGIDEWAWKKGNRYGTLVVDLEQQRVLTLLPERSVESATAWFQQHPDITIVSRDRGPLYRDAALAGVPHAIHVADRFHLQKNFAEALERYFRYQSAHLRHAAAALANQPTPPDPVLDPERVARHQRRVAAHAEVWTLLRAGYGKEQIARETGISARTVYRLLESDMPPPVRRRARGRSLVDPYLPYLSDRWNAGCANATQLYRELQQRGYGGSIRTVERHLQAFRTVPQQPVTAQTTIFTKVPTARSTALMIVRPPTARTPAQTAFLTRLRSTDATIAQIITLAESFGTLLREQGGVERLAVWQAEVRASGIAALVKFVDGLAGDADAVANACSLPWSNGIVEGFVNKIKAIKRSSYGRAGFALLQRRVLLHPG